MSTRPWNLLRVLLLLTLATCGTAQAKHAPAIDLGDTRIVGLASSDGAVESFLGVPFAEPPVGDLRWREPVSLHNPAVLVKANKFAPACYQGDHITRWYRGVISSFGGNPSTFKQPDVSEDCLYLNIWRPTSAGKELLPVMVYVHGGSNKGGWSYEPNYLGERLARHKVIVITVAYRLGVFGFLDHPGLPSRNYAILDIIRALQWISRNIEAAGGDKANITLIGESAGASNISQLLASPLAEGLFHRVIHQSAGWAVAGHRQRSEPSALGIQLADALIGPGGDIEKLRALPAEQVLAAADAVFADEGFDPFIDGVSLTNTLADSVKGGAIHPVDLLIGSNADEWKMYLDDNASIADWISENVHPTAQAMISDYFEDEQDEVAALDKLTTAVNYVCPSMLLASLTAKRGGRSWFYYFSRQREGPQAAQMGAYHGAELPYVFGTHDDWLPTGPEDRVLTEQLMAYWTNFARSGDPNGEGLASWLPFDEDRQSVLQLDVDIRNREHPSLQICSMLQQAPAQDDRQ